jgi:hypothetical protein
MFLSVRLNFRRPIYPGFYLFAKIFQTLSRDSPALGPTKLPVGTKVVPIVHTTRNVRGVAFHRATLKFLGRKVRSADISERQRQRAD